MPKSVDKDITVTSVFSSKFLLRKENYIMVWNVLKVLVPFILFLYCFKKHT